MDEQKLLELIKRSTADDGRCPDYDEDCKTMTLEHAHWCFMGCQNHRCNPGSNLGTAKGYCPILNKSN